MAGDWIVTGGVVGVCSWNEGFRQATVSLQDEAMFRPQAAIDNRFNRSKALRQKGRRIEAEALDAEAEKISCLAVGSKSQKVTS